MKRALIVLAAVVAVGMMSSSPAPAHRRYGVPTAAVVDTVSRPVNPAPCGWKELWEWWRSLSRARVRYLNAPNG